MVCLFLEEMALLVASVFVCILNFEIVREKLNSLLKITIQNAPITTNHIKIQKNEKKIEI